MDGTETLSAWEIFLEVVLASPLERQASITRLSHGDREKADEVKRLLESVGSRWLGRFQLQRFLGRGGYGYAFLCRQDIDREVVVKVPRTLNTPLASELNALVKLRHPGIVVLHDGPTMTVNQPAGKSVSVPLLVMEYVEGKPLTSLIGPDSTVSLENCVRILSETADALDYAHDRGIIHRDIKPANILIADAGGAVNVIDFGIAKLLGGKPESTTMYRLGTAGYMAPEYLEMGDVSKKIDQYSLAVVAERMFARTALGKLFPFSGHWMRATATGKALDPAMRYPSCRDFVSAFSSAVRQDLLEHLVTRLQKVAGENASIVHFAPGLSARVEASARDLAGVPARSRILAVVDIESRWMGAALGSGIVFSDQGCHAFGVEAFTQGKKRLRVVESYPSIPVRPFSFRDYSEHFPTPIGTMNYFLFSFGDGQFTIANDGPLGGALGGIVPGFLFESGKRKRLQTAENLVKEAANFVSTFGRV